MDGRRQNTIFMNLVNLHSKLSRLFLVAPIFFLPALSMAQVEMLTPFGYGEIRFGQPIEIAEARMHETAFPLRRELACDFVRFKKYPNIRWMVEDGIITRADVMGNIKNSASVSLGMPVSKVKALHPHVRIEAYQYDEQGHYLVLDSPDGGSAILLEESNGKVTNIRVKKKPLVEYVEGCL